MAFGGEAIDQPFRTGRVARRKSVFASVGSMLPFDRFVQGVDEWAAANPEVDCFIQIGGGEYEPQHAQWTRMMPHRDYLERLERCSLFVAHVGVGSILQALEARKQVLMLPRLASLGEHTTDHQLHTASRFGSIQGLKIVDDINSLKHEISTLLFAPLPEADQISEFAPVEFTTRISRYLNGLAD